MSNLQAGGALSEHIMHPVRAILPALLACERMGRPWRDLCASAEVDVGRLQDPQLVIPGPAVLTIWEGAQLLSGEPWFGLRVGLEQEGYASFEDHLLNSALSLEAGVRQLQNYYEETGSGLEIRVQSLSGGKALLSFGLVGERDFPTRAGFEYVVGRHIRSARLRFGATWQPQGLRFSWSGTSEVLPAGLDCTVEFGRNTAGVVLLSEEATQRAFEMDEELAELLQTSSEGDLPQMDPKLAFVDLVRRQLQDLLLDGRGASVESIARSLGVSTRSLQRKLQSAGKSFRSERERSIRLLAQRFRREGQSAKLIAQQLGFSDATAYYRAARRWETEELAPEHSA